MPLAIRHLIFLGVLALLLSSCVFGGGEDGPDAQVSLEQAAQSLSSHQVPCEIERVVGSTSSMAKQYKKLIDHGGVLPVKILDCGKTAFTGAEWRSHSDMVKTNNASDAALCAAGITEIPRDFESIVLAGERVIVTLPHEQGVVAHSVAEDTGLEKLDVSLDCD